MINQTSTKGQRGQALILIALAAVGLFAFSALAIDGSRAFSNKRHAQNAADTAVLAAALAEIRTPGDEAAKFAAAVAAARVRATSNGFTHNGDTVIVEINLCSDTGVTCEAVEAGHESEYIRVRIVSTIPTTFGRVLGRQTLTSAVEAIARVQGSSSTSSFPGQAVVALKKTGCGICNSGNANLTVHGSGVFSNSTSSVKPDCSMTFTGNIDLVSDKGFTMPAAGAMCKSPNTNVTGDLLAGAQVSPVYNIPAPTITCSGDAPIDGSTTLHPGRYSTKLQLNTGTYTFESGDYCFENGVDIKANVTANNVNFRINGGEFRTNGNVNFTCTNTLIYSAGGSGVHLNGNGDNTCTGVTFYIQSGSLTWNGTSAQKLKAPTSGPYKGLLIYVPESNGSELKINGTADNELVGSIIAPGSHIKLSGVSGSAGYDTQIVGSFIDMLGASNTVINFNPNNQYTPPQSPTIQLTK